MTRFEACLGHPMGEVSRPPPPITRNNGYLGGTFMRRTVTLIVMAALVAGAFAAAPAEAKKKKKKKTRTVSATYDSPALGVGGVAGLCVAPNGCVPFPAGPGEKFVSVTVEDASGTPSYGRVTQDLDGDGQADEATPFCGKTEQPVAIQPGVEINVFVYAVGAQPPCAGVGTSGTIKATFSNR